MSRRVFLAGFQKCGTDTLFGMLADAPGLRPCQPKEPHFHALAAGARDAEAYAACFPARPGATLDGSASHAVVEGAAQSIAAGGGDVRIVFLVRTHADRVWSSFHHMRRDRPCFEGRTFDDAVAWQEAGLHAALAAERERLDRAAAGGTIDLASFAQFGADADWNYRYLANTCYARHISRFVTLFGPECIHVESLGSLIAAPDAVIERVCRFIGTEPFAGRQATPRNITLMPVDSPIGRALSSRRLRALLRVVTTDRFRRRAKGLLKGVALERPPVIADEAHAALTRLFEEDRQDLEALLGRDPFAAER